jgi:hypothetical protein
MLRPDPDRQMIPRVGRPPWAKVAVECRRCGRRFLASPAVTHTQPRAISLCPQCRKDAPA